MWFIWELGGPFKRAKSPKEWRVKGAARGARTFFTSFAACHLLPVQTFPHTPTSSEERTSWRSLSQPQHVSEPALLAEKVPHRKHRTTADDHTMGATVPTLQEFLKCDNLGPFRELCPWDYCGGSHFAQEVAQSSWFCSVVLTREIKASVRTERLSVRAWPSALK